MRCSENIVNLTPLTPYASGLFEDIPLGHDDGADHGDQQHDAREQAQAVADSHGFGLTCMRERLQAIGGQFTLHSAPGAGTRIQVQAAARARP